MKELRFVAYAYWKSYADRGLSALLQILLIVYPIDFVFCNQFGCGNSTGYFRIVFDYIHRVALGGVRLETDAGRSSVDNEAGFSPVNLGIFTIIIFIVYFPEVVIRYELKNHIVFDLFQCSRLILV